MPAIISSPITPVDPLIFLSKIFAGKILNISKILKIKHDNNMRTISLPHINNGIDCPINSSMTISFGSLLLNFFKVFFKNKKEYIVIVININTNIFFEKKEIIV
jgi:hypothetical protein|tara:strand:- start:24 stop:335 length:312 start_codon:yes stop_codon:yes gene_type:complete